MIRSMSSCGTPLVTAKVEVELTRSQLASIGDTYMYMRGQLVS